MGRNTYGRKAQDVQSSEFGYFPHRARSQWTDVLWFQARENHPFLKRYRYDWATEEIVKQYFKNKRKHAYRSKWLKPPMKYQHLTEVSQKRTTSSSRIKKASIVLAARKAKKANKEGTTSKGKKKAMEEWDDDELAEWEVMGGDEEMVGGDEEDEDVDMDNVHEWNLS